MGRRVRARRQKGSIISAKQETGAESDGLYFGVSGRGSGRLIPAVSSPTRFPTTGEELRISAESETAFIAFGKGIFTMYLAKALATNILPKDLNERLSVAEIPDWGPEKSPQSPSQPGCDKVRNAHTAS